MGTLTAEQMKTVRRSLGLSAEAFGRVVGLKGINADVTVMRWENGLRSPSENTINFIADIYKKHYLEKFLKSFADFVGKTEKIPQAVVLFQCSEEKDYHTFLGLNFIPFWMQKKAIDLTSLIIKQIGMEILHSEANQNNYFSWLEERGWDDNPSHRASFIVHMKFVD